ncbi:MULTISPECIES: helix-turn-helix domain-containing protein [Bacillus cereus group]|uniref:helix-turn-helix domain-containing protein n=1 Tax=Bacillus cereus group TaxID=86661 RepID=UPI0013D0464B|nr:MULTISPECIES: helix-turn-helix domain-containing protein [Bacillus cereus group]MDA1686395.1 helix-turn-helix domain-containing protein [Bacillus cereus group sp. TH147LC]
MTRWINVQEAMKMLEEHYIQVSYKTFTDWLRKLEIPAIPSDNRKEGWAISKEDVLAFIDKKRPGLRQMLEGYQDLVEDMEQVKQQVRVLMESEPNIDEHVGVWDEEKRCNPVPVKSEIYNDEVKFLYDLLEMVLDELQEVKKQNEWMNQVYEQMIGDYNFIYEELKMKHENVEATALVEEEEVAKINEKEFHDLLEEQWKKKFPNEIFSLEDEEIKRFYTIFHKKLYHQGENKESVIIRKGDSYICPASQKEYKHINRIYNPVIRKILDNMIREEKEHKNDIILVENTL